MANCCELLSFCIFDVLNTVIKIFFPCQMSCELLSFCIFDVLNTVKDDSILAIVLL